MHHRSGEVPEVIASRTTTGWSFDISLLCENTMNNQCGSFSDYETAIVPDINETT